MRHHYIDRFSENKSILSIVPVSIKTVLLLLILFFILVLPFSWLLVFYILLLLLLFLSKIPVLYFFLRISILIPFIGFIGFILVLSKDKDWTLFSITVLRSLCSMGYILIFSLTTRFTFFIQFLKRMKFPIVIIHLLNFLYRYFFILIDEFERMQRAFLIKKTEKIHLKDLKNYLTMAGLLFIRSYERSYRILLVMIMRGYRI